VYREIGDQPLERALATREANGSLEIQRGLQDAIRDLLRQDVVDADDEPQRPHARPVLERLHHFLPEPEDLVRIAVDEPAHFRRHQRAPGLREQLLAEPRFERAQLPTDGRRGKRELFAGAGETSGAHDRPEVEQVLVVEPSYDRHVGRTPISIKPKHRRR